MKHFGVAKPETPKALDGADLWTYNHAKELIAGMLQDEAPQLTQAGWFVSAGELVDEPHKKEYVVAALKSHDKLFTAPKGDALAKRTIVKIAKAVAKEYGSRIKISLDSNTNKNEGEPGYSTAHNALLTMGK